MVKGRRQVLPMRVHPFNGLYFPIPPPAFHLRLVLINALRQIIGYTRIKGPMSTARKNVHEVKHTPSMPRASPRRHCLKSPSNTGSMDPGSVAGMTPEATALPITSAAKSAPHKPQLPRTTCPHSELVTPKAPHPPRCHPGQRPGNHTPLHQPHTHHS